MSPVLTELDRPGSSVCVSVIMPVRNGAAYVRNAVHSVLAQTHQALELIVVDDGSTDDTREVLSGVADRRLRVETQAASGAAAARNRGVAMADAPLLAFLDADDLWLPHKLTDQVAALAEHPEVDMVFGHYEEFDDDRGPRGNAAPGYSLGTLLVSTDVFRRVGPLSTQWQVGEFIDWYGRAIDVGCTSSMLPQVVLRRRVHEQNTTRGERQDYARVLGALHRRRRAERAG